MWIDGSGFLRVLAWVAGHGGAESHKSKGKKGQVLAGQAGGSVTSAGEGVCGSSGKSRSAHGYFGHQKAGDEFGCCQPTDV